MKIKIWIFFITCLCFLNGCSLGQKEQFNQYLIEHNYQEKKNCLQKIEQGSEDGNFIQRFCLDECKYYAYNEALNDFFIVDLDSQKINYVYDYITYQSSIKRKKSVCMFQGEEIDLNSSYCANAEKAVDRHIEILNQELNKAGMNMKRICRE